ncbi:hypothetical protein OG896_20505 [Streptomyces sp. NBC_00669]|uniref:hypothetical protein n=1 Tax=unclassified Streptomyces TaxID=2593676 RepID=UPI002E379D02|nr:hypothetical protein [Streptomyces sp. NBC_00669]
MHDHHHTAAPSLAGSVVLDIGERTGAVVIHTGPDEEGLEIEVSPTTDPTRRTHAAVRPRHLPDRTLHCLVLSSLEEGEYTVWRSPGIPHGTVTVSGGAVSEYHWR